MTLRNGLLTAGAWAVLLGFTALTFINSALQISLVASFVAILLVLFLGALLAYGTWAIWKTPTAGGIIAIVAAWLVWAPLVVASVYFAQEWLRHLPV